MGILIQHDPESKQDIVTLQTTGVVDATLKINGTKRELVNSTATGPF